MTTILGIGLGKTGTCSLAAALRLLGFSVRHCPRSPIELSTVDAAMDNPVAMWARMGIIPLVDCKLIYTTRAIAPWLESCEAHWGRSPSRDPAMFPAMHQSRDYLFGGQSFDEGRFRFAYEAHEGWVNSLPYPVLHYGLCDGEGWQPLCDFLGVAAPSVRFPRKNGR